MDITDDVVWFVQYHAAEIVMAVAIVFAVIGLTTMLVGHEERYERFIEQCMEDHKEYECVAMWRAGSRSPTLMPIIIPTVSP